MLLKAVSHYMYMCMIVTETIIVRQRLICINPSDVVVSVHVMPMATPALVNDGPLGLLLCQVAGSLTVCLTTPLRTIAVSPPSCLSGGRWPHDLST